MSVANGPLVFILDQFEEFFVFWPTRSQRRAFIEDFAVCYDDKDLPVRFVISLRKDYFWDLADFEQRILTIFQNHFRLEAMSREEATQAITAPAAKLAQPVSYAPDLLDVLLDDLDRGGMELPHLQIICTQLHQQASQASAATIDLAAYDHYGRAAGILGDYLNSVLEQYPGSNASLAKAWLKELVSSELTRRAVTQAALISRLEATRENADETLARLVNDRLVRRNEVGGEVFYELAHEYLIGEISRWIDPDELAAKQAVEVLAREVATWRASGTLIPRDRLELIYAQRARLGDIDDITGECLLRSAVRADFAVPEWTLLLGSGRQLLLPALSEAPNAEARLTLLRALGASWGWSEVAGLGDTDSGLRRAAAEALGQLGDVCAVEPLLAALLDEDSWVRSTAISGLRQLRNAGALEQLIVALKNEGSFVRQAAATALGALRDTRAVEPLIAALKDKDRSVVSAALTALGQLGDARVVEPLIAALEGPPVYVAAAESLGRLGDARAVEPLIAALKHEDYEVRSAAATALGQLGDVRAVEPTIAALDDQDAYGYVGIAAAEALGKLRDARAVERLIVALNDENEDVCPAAAESLGQLGDVRAVEPLIAALKHWNSGLRWAAATALGQLGDVRAVDPLIAALDDQDAFGDVGIAAAEALGKLRDACAVEPLIAALKDKNPEVRRTAATTLGQLGDVRAAEPLIAALKDENNDVHAAVAQALGRLRDVRAVEPLITILNDENQPWMVHRATARVLGQLGDACAVEPLIAALRNGFRLARSEAAAALGQLGDDRAIEPLITVLADANAGMRRAAALALGRLGNTRPVEPLIVALGDKSGNVRSAAAEALGQLGDARAMEPLASCLRDKSDDVCKAAQEALDRMRRREAVTTPSERIGK